MFFYNFANKQNTYYGNFKLNKAIISWTPK